MIDYSASDLTQNLKEKHELIGNVLGSFGNSNIRGHHIKYFEDRIKELMEEQNKDVVESPNFYAWLCIFSEHIFWLLRKFCMRHEAFNAEHLDLQYTKLVTTFFDCCRKLGRHSDDDINETYDKIAEVLMLRHAIIHRGFPNTLPISLSNQRSYSKPSPTNGARGGSYSKEDLKSIIDKFSNPQNFESIRDSFYSICGFLSKSPSVSLGF